MQNLSATEHAVLFFRGAYTRDDPEDRGNQADGEGKERLYRVAQDRGGARGQQGRRTETGIARTEEDQKQQQRDEQQHGRKAVIHKVRDIFIMRIVKIMRQGQISLMGGNGQAVFIYILIEPDFKGIGAVSRLSAARPALYTHTATRLLPKDSCGRPCIISCSSQRPPE